MGAAMRIACLSDLHGHFPSKIPTCDVLVIAGDVVDFDPGNQMNLRKQILDFREWLTELSHGRGILPIGIAGNHDLVFQEMPGVANNLPWVYLLDSAYMHEGVRFYGSPWQSWMSGWAFNAPERDGPSEPFLNRKFSQIPDGIDVLLTHTPPAGFHDTVGGKHRGSIALNEHIERVKPALAVYGHIHKPGVEQVDGVTLCNAAYVNYRRLPNKQPIQVFEL